jgi:hypothetical protein
MTDSVQGPERLAAGDTPNLAAIATRLNLAPQRAQEAWTWWLETRRDLALLLGYAGDLRAALRDIAHGEESDAMRKARAALAGVLLPDSGDAPPKHTAKATDWCYSVTGGVKVDCSCGDYWVLHAGADDADVLASIGRHLDEKRVSGAPDGLRASLVHAMSYARHRSTCANPPSDCSCGFNATMEKARAALGSAPRGTPE